MSSLFKATFQSKQSREFVDLACRAIPSLKADTAKLVYKSIKRGNNNQWTSLDFATEALEQKIKLNLSILSYTKIINDKNNKTLRQVQSAKSHLAKLTTNDDTDQLLRDLENGFSLQSGSLTPKAALNAALAPSSRRSSHRNRKRERERSRSVSVNNVMRPINTASRASDHFRKPYRHNRHRSVSRSKSKSRTSNKSSRDSSEGDNDSDEDEEEEHNDDSEEVDRNKKKKVNEREGRKKRTSPKESLSRQHRSMSVMQIPSGAASQTMLNAKNGKIPTINTKEYLQFLLERAVTNKAWNDNDADRLCKCAIAMQCDWITVHSMWVSQCYQLLRKYTVKKYKTDLKKHKKSKRRGSRISFPNADQFKEYKDEKEIKSDTKICVTIGYPLGQTSTVSKVAESKQSVQDGATRIRLMVSAGKVVTEDWDYILNEVKQVVGAANGVDVRIVFPDTAQITEELKHKFNQKIMQGMAGSNSNSKKSSLDSPKEGNDKPKRKKLKYTFSDDTSSNDDNEDDIDDTKSEQTKKGPKMRKQTHEPGSMSVVEKRMLKRKKQRRASTMQISNEKRRSSKGNKKVIKFTKRDDIYTSSDDSSDEEVIKSKPTKSKKKPPRKIKSRSYDPRTPETPKTPSGTTELAESRSEIIKPKQKRKKKVRRASTTTLKKKKKRKSAETRIEITLDEDDEEDMSDAEEQTSHKKSSEDSDGDTSVDDDVSIKSAPQKRSSILDQSVTQNIGSPATEPGATASSDESASKSKKKKKHKRIKSKSLRKVFNDDDEIDNNEDGEDEEVEPKKRKKRKKKKKSKEDVGDDVDDKESKKKKRKPKKRKSKQNKDEKRVSTPKSRRKNKLAPKTGSKIRTKSCNP